VTRQEVNSEGVTDMNQTVLCSGLLLVVFAASGQGMPPANKVQTEMPDVASGKQTYREYCASCHGEDGKGMGPAASALKTPPSDLTTLEKRHGGKFPADYVSEIVRFGKPIQAHGSSDMPVWGPIFNARDKFNEVAVRRRIKDLCAYLATLQEKES
jgi:mono/diheme cytochrome c family protein